MIFTDTTWALLVLLGVIIGYMSGVEIGRTHQTRRYRQTLPPTSGAAHGSDHDDPTET